MKYMASCRQTLTYLKNVDEIRFAYDERGRLSDFVSNVLNQTEWKQDMIFYVHKYYNNLDWEFFEKYREIFNIGFAFEDANMIEVARLHGYRNVFWMYPATTFYELRGLLNLGVSQVLIDGPLFFDLATVKQICEDVEIRIVADKCFNEYMPREDGICGTYIRPEDVDLYSEYVSHIEFAAQGDLQRERVLIEIYKEKKNWPGNLNLLLINLNYDVDNRGFTEEFAEKRIKCAQRCQRLGACSYCKSVFKLINTIQQNKDWLKIQLAAEE